MSTVDRGIAERFVAGEFREDEEVYQDIWAYENAWGGVSYKLMRKDAVLQPSAFIRKPQKLWTLGQPAVELHKAADQYEENAK